MARLKDELVRAGRIVTTARGAGHDAVNVAGGLAFLSSPQAALYRQVATSLWSGDGYYEKQDEWLRRFQENVAQVAAEEMRFAFQLAAYGRDKRGLALRTSPVALYAEASTRPEARGGQVGGRALAREYGPKVLRRADDPSEAVAYLRRRHGRLPHAVVRGIGDALAGFDAYQLGKYKETGRIRDMFRLARPTPAGDEQAALWKAAVARELPTPETWEVELSGARTDDEKRAAWNRLLESGKLGIFALLRNIRNVNVIEVHADVEVALEQFTRERTVGSGILPFQFYKAWKAVRAAGAPLIADHLAMALEWSLEGMAKLPGRTLVVCDNSSSMSRTVGTRGMDNAEIGNLMGAMALELCEDGWAGTFGDEFAIADAHSGQGLLDNKQRIDACGLTTGHSTEAWKVFQGLTADRIHVDRVVLFSDMQCYDGLTAGWNRGLGRVTGIYGGRSMAGELESYRQAINPNVRVYSVDLASQDNSGQFAPGQPVVALAGWSDSVFRFMAAMEAGEDALDRIRSDY